MAQGLGKYMSSSEIRAAFLDFFSHRDHQVLPSSSLIPYGDPTLLFTNAGMVQFKDIFAGFEKRSYKRAVTAQKCVRAGGKHNDLDNVGFTGRHHTFFEMLGNFSFGDYFKEMAICLAWEFLTKVLEFPKDRIWVTVYKDDDEAFELWKKVANVPSDRIVRLGNKDNFWAMGDTGPCGPCSEIIIDRGEQASCGPDCALGVCDCDRWLEIWNLVFMQYMRDEEGNMTPLPKPSIDTGFGLERVASLLQGADTNYGSDLFVPIIEKIRDIAQSTHDVSVFPYRVIADHIRTCAFLACDGVRPSNDGRGYVMRRILRRAVRFGKVLGIDGPFLGRIVPVVVDIMGDAYAELKKEEDYIEALLTDDETKFLNTLEEGQKRANIMISQALKSDSSTLSGKDAFVLHDTFGFPIDLTKDMAREMGLKVDVHEFESAMAAQRERSRKNRQDELGDRAVISEVSKSVPATEFLGYGCLSAEAKILGIVSGDSIVTEIAPEEDAVIILDVTPFYAESGGQESDTGVIRLFSASKNGFVDAAKVLSVHHAPGGIFLHRVKALRHGIMTGQKILAVVETQKRLGYTRHHTATHLIHRALKKVLGEHAQQSGSLVQDNRLRFDFHHSSALSQEQILQVENIVNQAVMSNFPVITREMSLEDARKSDATALFGEKYGETVRVVEIEDFSKELCGGTHVRRTGEIGQVQIVSEAAVASGIRRIEAVAGEAALERTRQNTNIVSFLSGRLGVQSAELPQKMESILETLAGLERQASLAKKNQIKTLSQELFASCLAVEKAGNRKVVYTRQDTLDQGELRELGDLLKEKGCSVAVMGSVKQGKPFLLVMVAEAEADKGVDAVSIVKKGAAYLGGSGGGKRHLAQAGGKSPENIEKALQLATDEAIRLLTEAYRI